MKTSYKYSLWQRVKDRLSAPFHSASTNYVKYLRSQGVKVGQGVVFRDAKSVTIDLTRPSLIEIGDNVDINVNFTITVFIKEFYSSSIYCLYKQRSFRVYPCAIFFLLQKFLQELPRT